MGRGPEPLSSEQWRAIRITYSEAFQKGMIAAAAVSCVAIILTLGGYRRAPKSIEEQRRALILAERRSEIPCVAPQSRLVDRDRTERE